MAKSKYLQLVGSIKDQIRRSSNRTPTLSRNQRARLDKTYGRGGYSLSPGKGYTQAGRVSTPQTSRFGYGSVPVYTKPAPPPQPAAPPRRPGMIRTPSGRITLDRNPSYRVPPSTGSGRPVGATSAAGGGYRPISLGGGGGAPAPAAPAFDFDAFFADQAERDRLNQEAMAKMQADMMAMFEGAMAKQAEQMRAMEAERLAAEQKRAEEFKVAQENLERGGRTADFKIGGNEFSRERRYGTTGFKRRSTAARTVAQGIAPISEKETV